MNTSANATVRLVALLPVLGSIMLSLAAPATASTPRAASPAASTPTKVATKALTSHRVASVNSQTMTLTLDNGQHITLTRQGYDRWMSALHAHHGSVAPNGAVTPGSGGVVSPDNTVPGSCGYSFDYLYDDGGLNYDALTGFHVNSTAVYFGWLIFVNGAGGTYYQQQFPDHGNINSFDWSHDYIGRVPAPDFYSTDVDPNDSYAILDSGDICTAAPGVYDDEYIS